MEASELKKVLTKPQVERLKALGPGLKIDKIVGNRVMVYPIVPYTEMDRLESEGSLVIPEHLREQYTPEASTGIIIGVGNGVSESDREYLSEGTMVMYHHMAGEKYTVDKNNVVVLDVREIRCTLLDTEDVVTPIKLKGE